MDSVDVQSGRADASHFRQWQPANWQLWVNNANTKPSRLPLTVPMRLWSLLLASACSLSHSCLSLSPGKATPRRRVKPEHCVSLDKVTDESWDKTGKRKRERNIYDWVVEWEWGSVRTIQKRKADSTSDGRQCVCKDQEQETGLWQTQHPATADISRQAAVESHSAQWQGSRGTPPSPWVNKDGKNSIHPAGVLQDKRCQTDPIKIHSERFPHSAKKNNRQDYYTFFSISKKTPGLRGSIMCYCPR